MRVAVVAAQFVSAAVKPFTAASGVTVFRDWLVFLRSVQFAEESRSRRSDQVEDVFQVSREAIIKFSLSWRAKM
jgi:hypothetical protein